MKRNHFLFEILFAVAALAIAGAVAVSLFVRADGLRKHARDLDMAVLTAQNAVENFKQSGEYTAEVYLDRNFNVVADTGNKRFAFTMDVSDDGTRLYNISITIERLKPYEDGETVVFELETAVYRGGAR